MKTMVIAKKGKKWGRVSIVSKKLLHEINEMQSGEIHELKESIREMRDTIQKHIDYKDTADKLIEGYKRELSLTNTRLELLQEIVEKGLKR